MPLLTRNALLHWRATDLSLTARSGQLGTLTRAGISYARTKSGLYMPHVNHAPQWEWSPDRDGGAARVGLRVNVARTNSALGSCLLADSTYWARHTSFTLATAVSCIAGQTAYKHTANSQWRHQSVGVFVNGQPDCVSFILENVDGATATVGIRDETAAAWLVMASHNYSTGVTTLGAGSGTVGSIVQDDGRVRVWCTGAGTAAGTGMAGHTRAAYVYPTNDGVSSSAIIHHGQFEANTSYPSAPMVTVGSTASSVADVFRFPFAAQVRQMSVFVDATHYAFAGRTAGTVYYDQALIGSTTPWLWMFGHTTAAVATPARAQFHDGSTSVTGTAGDATVPSGTRVRYRAQLQSDGKTLAGHRVGSAVEVASALSTALALPTAWSAQEFRVGQASGTPTTIMNVHRILVIPELASMDDLDNAA